MFNLKKKVKDSIAVMETIPTSINSEEESKDFEKNVQEALDYLTDVYSQSSNKTVRRVLDGQMTKENFEEDINIQLQAFDFDRDHKLTAKERTKIIEDYQASLLGYRNLDVLLDDDTISDIKILNPDNIRIKQLGKRKTSDIKFKNKHDYLNFIDLVITKNKVNIGEKNAIKVFTDKKTCEKAILRFNISTDFINSTEMPYVHIRKILKEKKTMNKLIEEGMLTNEQREYLENAVKNSTGILFTGKGASGKTTLMNAMLEIIPHDCSGLCIQESEELFCNTHPDLMFQHIVLNHGEGSVEYSLKDLAINGLLTDLDYFIIGEIKGGEAAYFLNASYTGHKCWASVHGMSSTEAINKLSDYVTYETRYSRQEILSMLKYMKTVVYLEDYKIKEISEIEGFDYATGEIKYKRVF